MSIMLPDVVVDTVNSGQPVSLEVVAIVSLILFLAVREVGDASRSRRSDQRFIEQLKNCE